MLKTGIAILAIVVMLVVVARLARRPLDPNSLPPDLPPECYDLVRENKVIQAIKIVREREGLGLKDARNRIYGRYVPPTQAQSRNATMSPDDRLPDECIELMRAGRKIDAIAAVRKSSGLSLAEAKARVEDWQSHAARPKVTSGDDPS